MFCETGVIDIDALLRKPAFSGTLQKEFQRNLLGELWLTQGIVPLGAANSSNRVHGTALQFLGGSFRVEAEVGKKKNRIKGRNEATLSSTLGTVAEI